MPYSASPSSNSSDAHFVHLFASAVYKGDEIAKGLDQKFEKLVPIALKN